MTQSLTLYSIEAELQQLLDLRETVEEEGALPEELAAIHKQIQEYFAREVKKVDGIAHAYRTYQNAAEQAKNEAQRILERAKVLQAQADRIKASALAAMQAHGITRLETPTNRLRIQANGGVQPLEIYDFAKVTLMYLKRTVTFDGEMTGVLLLILERCAGKIDDPDARAAAAKIAEAFMKPGEADTERIREALKKFVPCPECHKDGIPSAKQLVECQRCGSRGAVPATVPGARLLERGFHLRVE